MDEPHSSEPPRGQVLICGLGLRLAHLTLETLQALRTCRKIYHNFPGRKAAGQLRRLCAGVPVEARTPDRQKDQSSMPGSILAAAAGGGKVAFLCYGHPLALRGTAALLILRCRAEGIGYRVIASLSPLDDILVAVGAPAMHRGLQLHPAAAVDRRTPLQPGIPAIIMSLDALWPPGKTGAARFVKYLHTVYPPGHRMALIRCPSIIEGSALRLETELRGLAGALKKLKKAERHATSLFIPWLDQPPARTAVLPRRGGKSRE